MTLANSRGRHLIFLVVTLLLTFSVVAAVFSERKQEPKARPSGQTFKAERVIQAPPVTSNVKDLEVAGVSIVRPGTPSAALAINIINNSDQPLMALQISSGDENDGSSLGIDGLDDPDRPEVQIQPHSLKTIEWGLGEILEGYPITLSSATFANGKEYGTAHDLEMIHRFRERSKIKREAARAETAQKKESPQ